ncbi:MAG: hypothetical protein NUV84_03410, partial [Candidatus Uhrbacteria bacterium]|nr:hypothetical protein [Candidatus Uhrbacteria bacterium]
MKTERAMSAPPMGDQEAREGHESMRIFFERLRADGEILLGGSGFHIAFDSNIPAVMVFAHETRTVLINPEKILEKGLNEREMRYLFGHEIAHFVQLVSDPDTYMRTFELQEEKARSVPKKDRKKVEQMWGRFYNVFLDIHDNAIGDRRGVWAQKSRPGEHPRETLYSKFAPENLSGSPKTEQFLFGVLRRAMLGTEASLVIDADVKEVLEKPFMYLGRSYPNFFDFARKKFFDAELPLSTFLSVLERSAAPLFERFLQQDLAAGILDKATRPVDLDGSDMDPKAGKEMVRGVKKVKASPADKAAAKEAENFVEKMGGKGFSEAQIRRMLEIRERANEVYGSLVDLWQVFLQTVTSFEVQEES